MSKTVDFINGVSKDDIINQIVILAEELADKYHSEQLDKVARLYTIQMLIDSKIGERMAEIRNDEMDKT